MQSGPVRVTTIDELLALPPSANAVAVTFDDGFANFAQIAAPRLLHHGFPVTVFVVTDNVGRTNSWGNGSGIPELPLMDWKALASLQGRGVTIGAHTRTHRDLTRIPPAAVDEEVRGCADLIERRMGIRPAAFAYPYGRLDRSTAAVVSSTFRHACTTEFSTLDSQVTRDSIPRLDMYYFQQPGRLEAWGTRRFERFVAFRRGLRRVRRVAAATGMVR